MAAVNYLAIDSIQVSKERQRKHFDQKKLDELRASIEANGLLQPIVVEGDGNSKFELRAGERRLRVCKAIAAEGKQFSFGSEICPLGCIPTVSYFSLDEVSRYALELDENICRADLTWQERAKAIARYHELRGKIVAVEGRTQPIMTTAAELGDTGHQTVAASLVIAQHLDNPKVAQARDMKEAMRVIRSEKEAEHRAILARTFKPESSPHRLIHGDSFERVLEIPDASQDIWISDPPYCIGADRFGSQATTEHQYSDDEKEFNGIADFIAEQSYRIVKPDGFLYLFCDFRWFPTLDINLTLAGWSVWPRPLIWDKCGTGMLPEPDFGPRYSHEYILYARKGKRTVVKRAVPDVLSHPPVGDKHHAAQKPVSLYVDLLSRIAQPGDKVIDAFGGSGPILPAANILRLTATYIEKDVNQYNFALSRVGSKELDKQEEALHDDIVI